MAAPLSLLLHPYYFPERVEIYKAYMRSDFSTQQPNALTNILLINDQIKHEYESVFVNEAQNVAARLRQDLITRFSLLDFTVRTPLNWDEAKFLKIDVEMSVANTTNPVLFRSFAREVIRQRTLLHTRTLRLRLVPQHPSRTDSAAANGLGSPHSLVYALGREVVAKFMDGNQVSRRRGVSQVFLLWDGGMDGGIGWIALLQPGPLTGHSGWYGHRFSISAQGVRQVRWWIR